MVFIIAFTLSLILSAFATKEVMKAAFRFDVLDKPDKENAERKIHKKAIPLLGGLAIFVSFFFVLAIFSEKFLAGALNLNHLSGFAIGALILVVGGTLDDKFNLKPSRQIIFPILAIVSVIAGGVEISQLSNPFGETINLSVWFFISPLLISAWLMGMMYTTKLLDGVDGLVSGISLIASLIIFLFTVSAKYYQPDIALASAILAGTILGFLIFNWHPAKIFLGEGGSLLLGYILGVLAIISGGKIAIALLIMGIPILDVFWTIIRRLLKGKNPFKFSDRQHLHHRLLDLGLNQRQTVLVFCGISFIFGFSALFLQSKGKFFALLLLAFLMFLAVIFFRHLDRRQEKKEVLENDIVEKKTLLLQVCCAPCALYPSISLLQKKYDLTWYFYNPNILSQEEYDARLQAVKIVSEKYSIKLIVEPYEHDKWLKGTKGFENEPEKGLRCRYCYAFRLDKTASYAKEKGFDFFATSLTASPFKDSAAICEISQKLAKKYDIAFLPDNLRDDIMFKASQELAKQLGIYRQKFCGCEFAIGHLKKK